jgi:hypothetical protein
MAARKTKEEPTWVRHVNILKDFSQKLLTIANYITIQNSKTLQDLLDKNTTQKYLLDENKKACDCVKHCLYCSILHLPHHNRELAYRVQEVTKTVGAILGSIQRMLEREHQSQEAMFREYLEGYNRACVHRGKIDELAGMVSVEVQKIMDSQGTEIKRVTQKTAPNKNKKEEETKSHFNLEHAGQILFFGIDLPIPTGFAQEVAKKLIENIGIVLPYIELHDLSEKKQGSEQLRTAIVKIRKVFKNKKIPFIIENRARNGYLIRPK